MNVCMSPVMVAACKAACAERMTTLDAAIKLRRESLPLHSQDPNTDRYAETDWHREREALRLLLDQLSEEDE